MKKEKKYEKISLFLLALSMCVGFVGCNKTNEEPAADETTGDQTLYDDLGAPNYITVQSGKSVYNTISGYRPLYDDSTALMTMNVASTTLQATSSCSRAVFRETMRHTSV